MRNQFEIGLLVFIFVLFFFFFFFLLFHFVTTTKKNRIKLLKFVVLNIKATWAPEFFVSAIDKSKMPNERLKRAWERDLSTSASIGVLRAKIAWNKRFSFNCFENWLGVWLRERDGEWQIEKCVYLYFSTLLCVLYWIELECFYLWARRLSSLWNVPIQWHSSTTVCQLERNKPTMNIHIPTPVHIRIEKKRERESDSLCCGSYLISNDSHILFVHREIIRTYKLLELKL